MFDQCTQFSCMIQHSKNMPLNSRTFFPIRLPASRILGEWPNIQHHTMNYVFFRVLERCQGAGDWCQYWHRRAVSVPLCTFRSPTRYHGEERKCPRTGQLGFLLSFTIYIRGHQVRSWRAGVPAEFSSNPNQTHPK